MSENNKIAVRLTKLQTVVEFKNSEVQVFSWFESHDKIVEDDAIDAHCTSLLEVFRGAHLIPVDQISYSNYQHSENSVNVFVTIFRDLSDLTLYTIKNAVAGVLPEFILSYETFFEEYEFKNAGDAFVYQFIYSDDDEHRNKIENELKQYISGTLNWSDNYSNCLPVKMTEDDYDRIYNLTLVYTWEKKELVGIDK